MKEQTDTHRRCKRCREWKWNHDFDVVQGRWRRWICHDCEAHRKSLTYYRKTPAELDVIHARNMVNQNRRRKAAMDKRTKAALYYIDLLRQRGWSYRRFAEIPMSRNTVMDIVHGRRTFVCPSTVKKLREAFMQEAART